MTNFYNNNLFDSEYCHVQQNIYRSLKQLSTEMNVEKSKPKLSCLAEQNCATGNKQPIFGSIFDWQRDGASPLNQSLTFIGLAKYETVRDTRVKTDLLHDTSLHSKKHFGKPSALNTYKKTTYN